MNESTMTDKEIKKYYSDFSKEIIPLKKYQAKSLFMPLKNKAGIIFSSNVKFEYTKSKTFGLVKVFFKNRSIQNIKNEEYFDKNKNFIKSGEYEQAYYNISVYCENGFKFDCKIKVKNSYEKINEDIIKEKIRPIFIKQLKSIKNKKTLNKIDILISNYQNEESKFLSIDYI
jgi:hypothetical protein